MNHRSIAGIGVFILVLVVWWGYPSKAQTTSQSSSALNASTGPIFNYGPVTDFSKAQPNSSNVLRFRRGEQYNDPSSGQPDLDENSDPIFIWNAGSHFKREPLPFKDSDEVVVGTVTAGQSYLSNDKKRIYSEFKVTVEEPIKTIADAYLRKGETIDVDKLGGQVRWPSGKILIRGNATSSAPEIGGRYLMFLKFDPSAANYTLITGYHLKNSQAFRLDDMNNDDADWQDRKHPLRPETKSADEFLQHVRQQSSGSPKEDN